MTGESGGEALCWLCARALGQRVERHHAVPRSRGGRETVAVHPICHRALHATFVHAELERLVDQPAALRAHPAMARFLAWIARKPPDFHAPTFDRRRR